MKKRKYTADILKELSFLEAVSLRCPEDSDVLKALGDLYTAVGRFEEGLAVDRKLVEICPEDSLVWYNHACSCALTGCINEAFDSLEKAIMRGYDNHEWMLEDADLDSLKSDDRFKQLLSLISR